jgi:uncharacterized protein YidB (DUF937 family)
MGLMDIVNKLLGRKTPQSGNGLLDSLLPLLTKAGGLGGLAGLLGKFTGAGFGGHVKSWVGSGPNEALSADQVQQALGNDTVSQVAQQAGVSQDEAAGGIARMLPNLVNQLTPNGQMPTGNIHKSMKGLDLQSIVGALKQ